MLDLARTITAFPGWNVAIVDRGGVEASPSVSVDISRAREAWSFRPTMGLRDGIATYHAALFERPGFRPPPRR